MKRDLTNTRAYIRRNGGYLNPAEHDATITFQKLSLEYTRRGYPDFTIMKDGEIIGFVEAKPRESKELRKNQEVFKRFCERVGVPFLKWCPDDGEEPIRRLFSSS